MAREAAEDPKGRAARAAAAAAGARGAGSLAGAPRMPAATRRAPKHARASAARPRPIGVA